MKVNLDVSIEPLSVPRSGVLISPAKGDIYKASWTPSYIPLKEIPDSIIKRLCEDLERNMIKAKEES